MTEEQFSRAAELMREIGQLKVEIAEIDKHIEMFCKNGYYLLKVGVLCSVEIPKEMFEARRNEAEEYLKKLQAEFEDL